MTYDENDPLEKLYRSIRKIHHEYFPKDFACIGRIATEFLRFQQKFTVVIKHNKGVTE